MMYTGERLVPDCFGVGERIVIEHLDRYSFASYIIKGWGKRPDRPQILDAPCGVGYGAALLAEQTQADVEGLDNDRMTIEEAKRSYYSIPKLNFFVLDLDTDTVGDALFDVIVCFEGIEHVRDQKVVAEKLCRAVKSPGLVFVSTPRRGGPGAGSVFHTHELVREELEALFRPHLKSFEMYGQNLRVGDVSADHDPRYYVMVGLT